MDFWKSGPNLSFTVEPILNFAQTVEFLALGKALNKAQAGNMSNENTSVAGLHSRLAGLHSLIQDKNEAYKRFKRNNKNSQYFENFQSLKNVLEVSIEASMERYYSGLYKKLMEPSTSPKTYW